MMDPSSIPDILRPILADTSVEVRQEGVVFQFNADKPDTLLTIRQALLDSPDCQIYYLSEIFTTPGGDHALLAAWRSNA